MAEGWRTGTPTRGDVVRAYAGAAFAVLTWAGYYVIARLGYGLDFTLGDMVLVRYVVPAAILLPLAFRAGISRKVFAGIPWPRALAAALTGGIGFGWFLTSGLQYLPAGQGTIFAAATTPLFVLLIAWPVLRDVPRLGQVIGVGLIVLGNILVGVRGLGLGDGQWIGQIQMLIAGLSWSIYTVLVRLWSLEPMRATAAIAILSSIVIVPLFLFTLDSHFGEIALYKLVLQTLYIGAVVGLVANALYSWAIRIIGAPRAALMTAIVPASGTLIGIPVLGEIPSVIELTGVAVASFGMVFALGWGARLLRRG